MTDGGLAQALRERTRFGRLVHVPVCASTQDLAAEDRGSDDAVFWADHQTAGRGRQQRAWDDAGGDDLAVTWRVRAALPDPLALAASLPVALVSVLEPRAGRPLRVKWPNDVLAGDRKLAGVLVDVHSGSHPTWRIGTGVNVNRTAFPAPLAATATSLALLAGRPHDRAALLLDLALALDDLLRTLQAGRTDALVAAFGQRLGLLGQPVVVVAGGEHRGRLQALDFAHLLLDGGRRLPLGLVTAIRPA